MHELTQNDFDLLLNNKKIDKSLNKVASSEYNVKFGVPSSNKALDLLVNFRKYIFSTKYSRLKRIFLNAERLISNSEDDSQKLQKLVNTGNSITLGITLSLGILSIDLSSFFNFINIFELISIISLFGLDLPEEILELLRNLRVQKAIPKSLKRFISFPDTKNIQDLYAKYGFDSSSFTINSGNNLVLICAIFLLFIVQKVLIRYTINKYPKLLFIREHFEYNIFFKYWIQTSLELLLTTTYGFTLLNYKEGLSIFDFCLSLIVFVTLT